MHPDRGDTGPSLEEEYWELLSGEERQVLSGESLLGGLCAGIQRAMSMVMMHIFLSKI